MIMRSILTGLMVLLTSSFAGAAPLYYTFEGTITSFSSFENAVTADYFNITPDETTVSYIFEVDFERDTGIESNTAGNWLFFYCDLIEGEMITGERSETHRGYDLFHNTMANSGHLSGGSRLDIIAHETQTEDWQVQDWQVGQLIGFSDSGYFSEFGAVYAFGDAELTAISTINPLNPVPVPAALVLFGSGLISLVGARIVRRS